jgi:hypothetical protein
MVAIDEGAARPAHRTDVAENPARHDEKLSETEERFENADNK